MATKKAQSGGAELRWAWFLLGAREASCAGARLLLPGAFLVAIGAQLLAAFMLVDFRFAAFLQ